MLRVFLEAFVGTPDGGVDGYRGMFRRRSALPFGAFLAVPGVLPLFLGQELLPAAERGGVDGAPEAEGRAVEGAQHKGARSLQNAGGGSRHEPRGDKGAAVGTRIRDGLLRDNKMVPAVLATLALLVFAWLVVGAFMGGGSNEESANQVSLAQNEEEPDGGDTESPVPGVGNRVTDSYSAFESKDPFRLLKGTGSKDGKNGDSKSGEAKNRDGKADNGKASVMGADGGAVSNNGGDDARDSRDSIDQPLPGGPDFRGSQSGNGDLFSSGEDLPAP